MAKAIGFSLEYGDITTIEVDVVALKYARSFHGADQAVAIAISLTGVNSENIHPEIGEYDLVNTNGGIEAPLALYVGVDTLWQFRYTEIQEFSTHTLAILADAAPEVRRVAMTLHGVNY